MRKWLVCRRRVVATTTTGRFGVIQLERLAVSFRLTAWSLGCGCARPAGLPETPRRARSVYLVVSTNPLVENAVWKWRKRLGTAYELAVRTVLGVTSIDIRKDGALLAVATDESLSWELFNGNGTPVHYAVEVPMLLTEELVDYLREQGHDVPPRH